MTRINFKVSLVIVLCFVSGKSYNMYTTYAYRILYGLTVLGERGGERGESEIGRTGIIPDSSQLLDDREERTELNVSTAENTSTSSGIAYTRWGNSSCPDVDGTELVYSGRAAGSLHGTDYVCMPDDPEYQPCEHDGSNCETMNGVGLYNHTSVSPCFAVCAVCYISRRSTIIMIPAKVTCPLNWTYEYSGLLMTDRSNHSQHECVDKALKCNEITGAKPQTIFYPLFACNYCQHKPLTCVVCSR